MNKHMNVKEVTAVVRFVYDISVELPGEIFETEDQAIEYVFIQAEHEMSQPISLDPIETDILTISYTETTEPENQSGDQS